MTDYAAGAVPRRRRGFWSVLGGTWLNRKYTNLGSSIILGAAPTITFLLILYGPWMQEPVASVHPLSTVVIVGMFVANAVFYPFNREVYYRMTAPIRAGIGDLFVGGILLLIVWAVRVAIYVYLWVFSSTIGVLAFLYLLITEATGRGYRIVE